MYLSAGIFTTQPVSRVAPKKLYVNHVLGVVRLEYFASLRLHVRNHWQWHGELRKASGFFRLCVQYSFKSQPWLHTNRIIYYLFIYLFIYAPFSLGSVSNVGSPCIVDCYSSHHSNNRLHLLLFPVHPTAGSRSEAAEARRRAD